jgi:hypothetical protein
VQLTSGCFSLGVAPPLGLDVEDSLSQTPNIHIYTWLAILFLFVFSSSTEEWDFPRLGDLANSGINEITGVDRGAHHGDYLPWCVWHIAIAFYVKNLGRLCVSRCHDGLSQPQTHF